MDNIKNEQFQKTMAFLNEGKIYYRSAILNNNISDLHHALIYIKAACSDLIKYGLTDATAAYWCALVYSRLSVSYFKKEDYTRSLEHAEKGLHLIEKISQKWDIDSTDMDPSDSPDLLQVRLYYAKGACSLRIGNHEEAEKYLRLGLELNPNHNELTNAFHEAQSELDTFQRDRSIGRYKREDESELRRKVPHSFEG
eukprot:NODE_5_length_72347_cov_1.339331.p44 type:complete len:197 gc:universal NODE_5_length_72347_cov_1.339331:3743-4333(+)